MNKITKIDNDYIVLEATLNVMDMNEPYQNVNIEIYLEDIDNEDIRINIGHATLCLSMFDSIGYFHLNYFYLLLDLDCYVGVGNEIFNAIFIDGRYGTRINKKLVPYYPNHEDFPKIFVLDKLVINPEYRDKNIGSVVLRQLENAYGYGRLKVLKAFPLEENGENYIGDDFSDKEKRLFRFYRRNGYKILKDGVFFKC